MRHNANDRDRLRFEAEILPYLDDCFRFAYALTSDRGEAEDLAQETFLRAFRAYSKFRAGTKAKAWLFTIMRNLWREKGRKKKKEESLEDVQHYGEKELTSSPQNNPEEIVLEKLRNFELTELLDALPPIFKECLILCDVEGYAYKEAAKILRTKEGTIKSRLFRARNMLKRALLLKWQNEL